jgi:hypothetical protein
LQYIFYLKIKTKTKPMEKESPNSNTNSNITNVHVNLNDSKPKSNLIPIIIFIVLAALGAIFWIFFSNDTTLQEEQQHEVHQVVSGRG